MTGQETVQTRSVNSLLDALWIYHALSWSWFVLCCHCLLDNRSICIQICSYLHFECVKNIFFVYFTSKFMNQNWKLPTFGLCFQWSAFCVTALASLDIIVITFHRQDCLNSGCQNNCEIITCCMVMVLSKAKSIFLTFIEIFYCILFLFHSLYFWVRILLTFIFVVFGFLSLKHYHGIKAVLLRWYNHYDFSFILLYSIPVLWISGQNALKVVYWFYWSINGIFHRK